MRRQWSNESDPPFAAKYDGEDRAILGGHQPRAALTVDGRARAVVAEELTGAERAAAWDVFVRAHPGYAAYESRAPSRSFGLFALRPAD